jgi:hypothetical protein
MIAARPSRASRLARPGPAKTTPAFFAQAAALIETPWAGAAIPDFVHPATRGKRPENFETRSSKAQNRDRPKAFQPRNCYRMGPHAGVVSDWSSGIDDRPVQTELRAELRSLGASGSLSGCDGST